MLKLGVRWKTVRCAACCAMTGMAWQGYYLDTEGNTFGIHQPDPGAR